MRSTNSVISARLKATGKKATDIAQEIGVEEGAVRHWLNRRRTPSPKYWQPLADALGISLARLTASFAQK